MIIAEKQHDVMTGHAGGKMLKEGDNCQHMRGKAMYALGRLYADDDVECDFMWNEDDVLKSPFSDLSRDCYRTVR